MTTARVVAWADGSPLPSIADELRMRPGSWAVVGTRLTPHDVEVLRYEVHQNDGFESQVSPCDDGEYGVLYELTARALPADTSSVRDAPAALLSALAAGGVSYIDAATDTVDASASDIAAALIASGWTPPGGAR